MTRAGQERETVAVLVALAAPERERLERAIGHGRMVWNSDGTWDEKLAQASIVFGNPPVDWLARMPEVHWIQLESVGYDDYAAAADVARRPIAITNLHGLFANPTAETAIAGVLALYRAIDDTFDARHTRQWITGDVRARTRTLHSSSAVVLGNGSIGSTVRARLQAFGCTVRSYARHDADLTTLDELDDALPEADVVVCCLPASPQTDGMFDNRRLGLLRPDAVFVNVGRGGLVDEQALASALSDSKVGGAVLDVTQEEPLPPEHPFWSTPRTILTQHTGGGYREELADKVTRFLENLDRLRSGQPLRHLIPSAVSS